MREIINLHIGQAGVRIGHAYWELLSLEHGLNQDGTMKLDHNSQNDNYDVMFSETQSGRYTPRSLFIDLEPSINDEVQKGPLRELFSKNSFISGKEDSSNNCVRAAYTVGRKPFEISQDQIRKLVENCDSLQGFIITNALSGGTGSGVTSNVVQRLGVDYAKKTKVGHTLFPSSNYSDTIVDVYNVVLAMEDSRDFDLVVVLENEAIYNICSKHLENEQPSFSDINRLIAQMISNFTVSSRIKGGSFNASLKEIQTNLVPYPNLYFAFVASAPFIPIENTHKNQLTCLQLTKAVFQADHHFAQINTRNEILGSCNLMYRGNIPLQMVHNVLQKKKDDLNFANFNKTGFKVGVHQSPPLIIPDRMQAQVNKNVCLLKNTSSFAQTLERTLERFQSLYTRRAFVHWFIGEGGGSGLFPEAEYGFQQLHKDYSSTLNTQDSEPEEEED